MAKITINGITVDPEAQGPALAAANLTSADASASNYILIQTAAPLTRAQRAELERRGGEILEYVPENTYVCRYTPTDLAAIRTLPFVTWADIYLREFKVAPSLTGLPPVAGNRDLVEIAAAPPGTHGWDQHVVDVVLHQDVDPESVRQKLAAAVHLDPDDLRLSRHKIRVTAQRRDLPAVAALDEVRHIEEVRPAQLHNNVARGILRAGVPITATTVLEGRGQTIAVADTGFDKGSRTDVHPAFAGRVRRLYRLGRPTTASDPHGHGTHVAGSVLGNGSSATLGIDIRGTAPRARLVLQSLMDALGRLGGLPDDLTELFQPPYTNEGARVHTNSWGTNPGDGRYDSNARELDEFVWNHRDLVIVFAAGNEGTDSDANGQIDAMSVTPPGTAKNCITVGATENDRPTVTLTYGSGWPSDFPAAPISADRVADNPEGMVAFSSRGPTRDNRVKPDVVAPGTFVLSTRSRLTTSEGWGLTADPLYFFDGGTSMAAPLVAGCAAVVREYLIRRRGIATPSAALVKAMLINGARNIAGQYVPSESPGIPNNAEGFGLVDLAATIGPFAAGARPEVMDEGTALDVGEEGTLDITVPAGARLLKVTLVWTDPPGDTLQNDLDLIVRAAGGVERHGNVAASATAFDRLNNVEQVLWTDPPPGPASIIVRAFRITLLPQPYALVVRIG